MESFIQLRKGTTPRKIHRDLDGLKDDELGRYGFTGRTAHMYRRNDPTTFRAEGPLQGVDVQTTGLRPTDQDDPAGEPLLFQTEVDGSHEVRLKRKGRTPSPPSNPIW